MEWEEKMTRAPKRAEAKQMTIRVLRPNQYLEGSKRHKFAALFRNNGSVRDFIRRAIEAGAKEGYGYLFWFRREGLIELHDQGGQVR
jgi:hypothetical protein